MHLKTMSLIDAIAFIGSLAILDSIINLMIYQFCLIQCSPVWAYTWLCNN